MNRIFFIVWVYVENIMFNDANTKGTWTMLRWTEMNFFNGSHVVWNYNLTSRGLLELEHFLIWYKQLKHEAWSAHTEEQSCLIWGEMIEFISPVLRLRIVFLQELLPVVVQHGDWHQFLIVHQMDYFDIHETLQGGCLCRNGKRHLDTFKTTWSPR